MRPNPYVEAQAQKLAAQLGTPHVDPEKLTFPALAQGYIGRVPWAIVERGDGLILAIGGENIPIDTEPEYLAARELGRHLAHTWRITR